MVHKSETCLEIKPLNEDDQNSSEIADFVLINNSPIDLGHVLFVPRLYAGLNQVSIFS